HPLQRALRPDKLTLAALEVTLLLHLDPERARAEIPALRMLAEETAPALARAAELARLTGGGVTESGARGRGGGLPVRELPRYACAVEVELAQRLRNAATPVVAVVRDDQTLLDCRTITDDEVAIVAAAVAECRSA